MVKISGASAPRDTVAYLLVAMSLPAIPAFTQMQAETEIAETIIVTSARGGGFGAKTGVPLERMPESVPLIDRQERIARTASRGASPLYPEEPWTLSVRLGARF